MRFSRRLKRTTKQYIMVALICIIVIGSAAISTSFIIIGQIREEYENILKEARQEMEDNKKSVYIAKSNIRSGEILSIDKVEEQIVYSSQPIESYITKNDLNKPAMIDIPEGTHIVKGMLAKNTVSSVLREVEYDVIHISSNIEPNDYVDVRIVYPNGESYVVLSKKPLKGFQPDTPICYLWVDEEELLRMSAAIVDAGLYHGSSLFMTKYIEPNIQEASIITYTPSVSVLSLIENDPNIVTRLSQELNKEVRKALENRLAESMGMDVSEINWELKNAISYIPEVLSQHLSDEDESPGHVLEGDIGEENIEENIEKNMEEIIEEKVDDIVDDIVDESEYYYPELGDLDGVHHYMATEG